MSNCTKITAFGQICLEILICYQEIFICVRQCVDSRCKWVKVKKNSNSCFEKAWSHDKVACHMTSSSHMTSHVIHLTSNHGSFIIYSFTK